MRKYVLTYFTNNKNTILQSIFRILLVYSKEWVDIFILSCWNVSTNAKQKSTPIQDFKCDRILQNSLFPDMYLTHQDLPFLWLPTHYLLKIKYLILFISQERCHNISRKSYRTFIATLKLTVDHSSWLPKFTVGFLMSFEPSICSV